MKPYVPYVQSGNKPNSPQRPQQNSGGYGQSYASGPSSTNTYGSSAYAPAPAAGGGYAPSAYGTTPTTTTTTPSSGYSSAYAPASSGGGYSSSPPRPSAPARPTTPDFSQALDRPPPSRPQNPPATAPSAAAAAATTTNNAYGSSYGAPAAGNSYSGAQRNDGKPYDSSKYAVATPVVGGGIGAAPHNMVYSGGPTNGLVSEGNPTVCHKVDYEIKGHEMQLVEIELDPEETVVAEAGAMMFLDEGINFKTKLGDGSEPKQGFFKKLFSAGGRLLSGESLFMTHFTNKGHAKARVAFAAPFPGTIIPVNMANYGNKIICQKDAFLCAARGTKLSIHFNKKLGSGLFGGEGFILQKLQGDGMAFIHAGGTVIKRELRGEKLRLDTGCLVGFTDGISYDIQFVPGLKSIIFGGEGLFLATLQGHGTVWMQSLPFSRMADRIIQHAPSAGGRRQGEGSALTGGFGDVLNGDGFGFKL